MPKPDFPPSGEIRLTRLVVSAGPNRVELDGNGITLNSPAVQDLIAKVFAPPGNAEDQAKEAALTQDLAASATPLAKSIADNTPKP